MYKRKNIINERTGLSVNKYSNDNNSIKTDKKVMLTDFQKSIISECNITSTWVVRIPTISDKEYDELVWAFRVIGGTWSEQQGGFVFASDPTQAIKTLLEKGEYIISPEEQTREDVQFYETTEKDAAFLASLANLQSGDVVLEPSAGHGRLLATFPEDVSAIVVEFLQENYEVLVEKHRNGEFRTKEITFYHGDFLAVNGLKYNKVVMNPPFSNFQDLRHVVHAYSMLEVGGTLVAIIGSNSMIRSQYNKEAGEYVKILRTAKSFELIPLPSCSFVESGTTVDTVIIKLVK